MNDRKNPASGGDVNCLHCQLFDLIDGFVREQSGGLHAFPLAAALSEVVADLLVPAPADKRARCVEHVVEVIRTRVEMFGKPDGAGSTASAMLSPTRH